jgi:hypothetical protein
MLSASKVVSEVVSCAVLTFPSKADIPASGPFISFHRHVSHTTAHSTRPFYSGQKLMEAWLCLGKRRDEMVAQRHSSKQSDHRPREDTRRSWRHTAPPSNLEKVSRSDIHAYSLG